MVKVGVQVFKRKFHTHLHLDYAKLEFLSCKKKKDKTKGQFGKDITLTPTKTFPKKYVHSPFEFFFLKSLSTYKF